MTAKRPTAFRPPPVEAATITTLSVAPWKVTEALHGIPELPAGRQQKVPIGVAEDNCTTSTRMLSSTPATAPPTVRGEGATAP